MKFSDDYICRKICGETLIVPVGEKTKEYNGIFTLSETGDFLLRAFIDGADAAAAAKKLAEEFEIDDDGARRDVDEFLAQLIAFGVLINE